jgi:ABC-type transport system involved in multi-copper enzyme maturation permease subunit
MSDLSLLTRADILKLRRRRGLMVLTGLLTVGVISLLYTAFELLALANSNNSGPRGGVASLDRSTFLIGLLASVAATLVGATAGGGDLDARVYRDLVVTGRSRWQLFAARIPAGLAIVLPFTIVAYTIAVGVSTFVAGPPPKPTLAVDLETGAWLVLSVAFYYVLAVGLSSVLGSRTYTIASILAFTLAITPLLSAVSLLGVARAAVPGVALRDLAPHGLRALLAQGSPVNVSVSVCVVVLVAWSAAFVLGGGHRDARRDA